MADARDSIIELGNQARLIQASASNKKAIRLAGLAVTHATRALMDHNTADTQAFHSHDGANMHMAMAKDYLTQAAYIHGNDVASGEAPSSTVLDLKYLGKGQELHEDYAADLTEGKNNYVR